MKAADLRALVRFSEDGPVHAGVAESDHLWSEIVCLNANQSIGPITDPDSDALCLVVTGTVAAQVDRGRKRLDQWETILVSAGTTLVLKNATSDPAVVLLVAAPPPLLRPMTD